ncbi:MAG TPA: Txe/YoeB family addiction module toxin [Candidatus Saccharimonadales bacterium]
MNGYEQREYEPLKENYAGLWSRRIDAEHRLIYRAADDANYIIACRYHYE